MNDDEKTTPVEPDVTPSLVAGLRGGEPEAGTLLNRIYREALVRFCWGYLGRVDEAEDAVQDVCCKVLSTREVPEAFRPWIYKLARNHCLNLRRDRARRPDDVPLPSASQLSEALTGHLTRLARHEQAAQVAELVRGLPEEQQEVLRLRYVEGLSRSEIAEVLDVTEGLVKSRIFQGLQRLRRDAQSFQNET